MRVGYYNRKKHAAILIYEDENCETMPKRFYWNKEDKNGTAFNAEDLAMQAFNKHETDQPYLAMAV